MIYLAASAVIALGYSIFYFEVKLPNGSTAQLLDIMDYISNSVMMPLIALLSTILIGWVKAPEYVIGEMELGGYPFRRKRVYIVMIRYIAPIMMLILFLQSTGILAKSENAMQEMYHPGSSPAFIVFFDSLSFSPASAISPIRRRCWLPFPKIIRSRLYDSRSIWYNCFDCTLLVQLI